MTCLAISSESPITSTSRAPSSRAVRKPSSSASYSATLFVAVPSSCACSASTSPSGVVITHAAAAGPGFPRAPPSTCTISRVPAIGANRPAGPGGCARERRHIAGDTRPAPVAHDAPLRLARLARAGAPAACTAVEAAAVDDNGDVVLVLVVGDEPRVELIGERSGHHAVDHRGDSTRRLPGRQTLIRPLR